MINGIPEYNRATPITRQVAATMIQNVKQIQDLKPIRPDKAIKVKLLDAADDWSSPIDSGTCLPRNSRP